MSDATLPRVLAFAGRGRSLTFAEHVALAGTRDQVAHRGDRLIDAVAAAGLRGRGGAAFPTAVKMRAVARQRGRRALVVNGAESEPLSAKDRTLLELAPHLVLDGALLAAEAIGARDLVLAVKGTAWEAHAALDHALSERRDAGRVRIQSPWPSYIAGEESALLRQLSGGPAKPTVTPPRPFERGLRGRPTLVANVETLAHLALIARRGAAWFRELGTGGHSGSTLVTIGGAVDRPGVYEIALGAPIAEVVSHAGSRGLPRAVLVGGYYGSWLSAGLGSTTLDNEALRTHGAALGAGIVFALPADACPVAEMTRVVRWMADQNAGQCGPCIYGLDAIAGAVASVAAGAAGPDVIARLNRWSSQVEGRGACGHPDGVVRFLRSALTVFADEIHDHRHYGPCDACHRLPFLPVPDTEARQAA